MKLSFLSQKINRSNICQSPECIALLRLVILTNEVIIWSENCPL